MFFQSRDKPKRKNLRRKKQSSTTANPVQKKLKRIKRSLSARRRPPVSVPSVPGPPAPSSSRRRSSRGQRRSNRKPHDEENEDYAFDDSAEGASFYSAHWNAAGSLSFLPPDSRTFLRNALSILRQPPPPNSADNPSSTSLMAAPVASFLLSLTPDRLAVLLNSKLGSDVMDAFLPHVEQGAFVMFWERLVSYFRDLIQGNFSSYVIEVLLRGLPNFFPPKKQSHQQPQENGPLEAILDSIFGELVTESPPSYSVIDFRALLEHRSASPVIRELLLTMKLYGRQQQRIGRGLIEGIVRGLRVNPNRRAFFQNEFLAPTIVVSLQVCRIWVPRELHLDLVCLLLGLTGYSTENELDFLPAVPFIRRMVVSKSGSHVIEAIVRSLSMAHLNLFVHQVFVDSAQFRKLAFHPIGNFVVAAIYERCENPSLFTFLWRLLVEGDGADVPGLGKRTVGALARLWDARRRALVLNVIRCCIRFKVYVNDVIQDLFFYGLETAAPGEEEGERDEEMSVSFSEEWKMRTVARFMREETDANGVRVVRSGCNLLGLLYAKIDCTDLLRLNEGFYQTFSEHADLLPFLAKDVSGANFLERFFTVFKRNRSLLIQLRPCVVELAVHRSACRLLQKAWFLANSRIKTMFGRILIDREDEVKGTLSGRVTFSRLKLHKLKRGKSARAWRHSLLSETGPRLAVEQKRREEGDARREHATRRRERRGGGGEGQQQQIGRGRRQSQTPNLRPQLQVQRPTRQPPPSRRDLRSLDWLTSTKHAKVGEKRSRTQFEGTHPPRSEEQEVDDGPVRKRRRITTEESGKEASPEASAFVLDEDRVPAWLRD